MQHRTNVAAGNRRLPAPSLTQSLALAAVLVVSLSTRAQATVYTHNATARVASYPSLPALFGEPFLEGYMYEGTLQYLAENPFLCEAVNWTTTSFIQPKPQQEGEEQPIVLLAARGQCPFHYKAMVAESLGGRVEYLVIYNHNLDGENVLVPMYSEYGTTRLKLLSVTHSTGLELKQYIANASPETMAQGGPLLSMDATPPPGLMTPQDLQDALISTLGLFFMLVSFSGCFLMCAAAAQHGRQRHQHANARGAASPIWMILMGDPDTDPVVVGDAAVAARALGGRTLLTQEEVEDYLMNREHSSQPTPPQQEENNNPNTQEEATPAIVPDRAGVEPSDTAASLSSQSEQATSTNDSHCAICIDDFDESNQEGILRLPCNHTFHADCIVPWLTERQSKCPLCKYDVFHYVQELAAQDPEPRRRPSRRGLYLFPGRSWFTSWTAITTNEEEEQEDTIGEDDRSTTSRVLTELEMAETDHNSSSGAADRRFSAVSY